MSTPRLNVHGAGWEVLQNQDALDLLGNAYDNLKPSTTRPVQFGARYGWVTGADGIPVYQQTTLAGGAASGGPIGQWLGWPGIGGDGARSQAQWGQVFAAVTTDDSPLKAAPVSSGDAGGWYQDPTLGELPCFTFDGSVPTIGTFGVVVAGSSLDLQYNLFFQGGAGAAVFPAIIVVGLGSGYWTVDIYANGYGSGVTDPSETAYQIDLNSYDYQAGDQVTVFNSGGSFYIATVRQFQTPTIPARTLARISVNHADGTYDWVELDSAAPNVDTSGGATGTAKEQNGSTVLKVGTAVWIEYNPKDNTYYIDLPMGGCSA